MYIVGSFFALALALLAPSFALAGDASTTRIETRAFYGATVTLEHGVRVYRALPAHDRVVINPGGRTPVHLGIEEHRATINNHYYDHSGQGRAQSAAAPVYGPGVGGYFVPHHKVRHHKHSHGGRLVPLRKRD